MNVKLKDCWAADLAGAMARAGLLADGGRTVRCNSVKAEQGWARRRAVKPCAAMRGGV